MVSVGKRQGQSDREKQKHRHLWKFAVNSSKPAHKVFAALLY